MYLFQISTMLMIMGGSIWAETLFCRNPLHEKVISMKGKGVLEQEAQDYRKSNFSDLLRNNLGLSITSVASDVFLVEDQGYPDFISSIGKVEHAVIELEGQSIETSIVGAEYTKTSGSYIITGALLCDCAQLDQSGIDFCGSVLPDIIDNVLDLSECHYAGKKDCLI